MTNKGWATLGLYISFFGAVLGGIGFFILATLGIYFKFFGTVLVGIGGFIWNYYNRLSSSEKSQSILDNTEEIKKYILEAKKIIEEKQESESKIKQDKRMNQDKPSKLQNNNKGIIVENPTNTVIQNNVNSPNSVQNVNQRKLIKKDVLVEQGQNSNSYFLHITFNQTDGIWDPSQRFEFTLQLNQPFTEYKFLKGFTGAFQSIITSENRETGFLHFSTITPPLNEPIVLEVLSSNRNDIKSLSLSPREE